MRKAYQIFAYLVAVEVVVQAAAIAYGLAGLSKWIEDDGGVLNKQLLDSDNGLKFQGVGGFAVHGINGTMVVPLVALLFLIFSFFAKVPGASKRAGIITLLVIVQVILGITLHSEPLVAPLHAINAFIIFSLAVMTGVQVGKTAPMADSPAPQPATV